MIATKTVQQRLENHNLLVFFVHFLRHHKYFSVRLLSYAYTEAFKVPLVKKGKNSWVPPQYLKRSFMSYIGFFKKYVKVEKFGRFTYISSKALINEVIAYISGKLYPDRHYKESRLKENGFRKCSIGGVPLYDFNYIDFREQMADTDYFRELYSEVGLDG